MVEIIKSVFDRYNIIYKEEQIVKLAKFYEMLIRENEKYNLTSITDPYNVATKHFLDCVLIQDLFKPNATVADIGCGAGFPSIPLKIMRPDLQFALVDSLGKRIKFLEMVINELELTNMLCFHVRCEDFAQTEMRESFDHVTARAVANLPTLLEYCMPFVKVGGTAILMKAKSANDEIGESKNAFDLMKSRLVEVFEYEFDELVSRRAALVIGKYGIIDKKYPRAKGTPQKNPL